MRTVFKALAALSILALMASPARATDVKTAPRPFRVVPAEQAEHYLTLGVKVVGIAPRRLGVGGPAVSALAEVDKSAPTMVVYWTSNDLVVGVITPKWKGENFANQAERHKQAVAAAKAAFPSTGPPPPPPAPPGALSDGWILAYWPHYFETEPWQSLVGVCTREQPAMMPIGSDWAQNYAAQLALHQAAIAACQVEFPSS